ncbi:unnamed protein product [Rhizophagus irregularis]|nr:unnamed protein product [Rhizophagus irregularis]
MSISLLFLLLIWKKYWVFSFDFLSKEDLLLSTLAKSRFFFRSFPLLKPNFKADPLLLSTLAKSRVFFVVKAKIYRQLCFFFTSVGSFPLLKPNFKADPISKVTFHFDSYGRSSPDSDDTESVTSTTSEHEKCTWKL